MCRQSPPRWSLALAIGLTLGPARAYAQCPQPNANDQEPDTEAIQCLLDQGGTIVLLADTQFAYYIAPHPTTGQGLILRHSGTVLTSTSSFGYRALLRATPNLNVPMLQVESGGVSNYRIEKIWLYGARFDRTSPNCSGDQSVNLWLRGSGWTVNDIESDTAPCNTSTVADGTTSGFTISNSWFANNGWGETELPGGACTPTKCWADGLTVHACVDGWIHDNHFRDNTDVNLVVGGGARCTIEYNDIQNTLSYGFAGLHVGWYPGAGNGNHATNQYRFNTVSAGLDKLAFGVVVGFHPWSWRQPDQVSDAGAVTDNSSNGAVVNLAVDGIASGIFDRNSGTGARGSNAFGNCTLLADYTAADLGSAVVQSGSIFRRYHDGTCGS